MTYNDLQIIITKLLVNLEKWIKIITYIYLSPKKS